MTTTQKQRAYLEFIRNYFAVHREAPAEADMQGFFMVTPPAVHRMVIALAEKGLITREPGKARSIRLVDVVPATPPILENGQPTRPPDEITAPLDPEIAALVQALRDDQRILTQGSCWGHLKRPAYIDLAVEGLDALRTFVERVNVIDRKVRKQAFMDIGLNWSEEVVTSCAFDVFPNWIMLSWRIEGAGRGGSPAAALLAKIATSYRRAIPALTPPRTP